MSQVQKNKICLKGSAKYICEFMDYGLNSIFFQREVYPSSDFIIEKKHGLSVWLCQDEELKKYLSTVLDQMRVWIEEGNLMEVTLVLISVESGDTLERWSFSIESGDELENAKAGKDVEVDVAEIQKGIKDVVRQIVSTVTFLPAIEEGVKFDLLFETKNDVSVENWDPNTPHIIQGECDSVNVRSWSTKIHTVKTAVTYKK